MKDSVAGIEKALNSPSFINNGGGSANNNGSNGNSGANNTPNGLNSLTTGKSSPANLDKKNQKIYENACREIDQLKKMF